MHKFALNKSRMSSLSSNSRLNFKHQFEQINHNLQSKGQLRSKILFQLITYLMGVVTIALILQLNANVQQYLTYLNDNQYLLSINSEFGSPVYSGYGVGVCLRADLRSYADRSISQAEFDKLTRIYAAMTDVTISIVHSSIINSFGNPILLPILQHPQVIYKSMQNIMKVQAQNGTYKQLIHDLLSSFNMIATAVQQQTMPSVNHQATTFTLSNILNYHNTMDSIEQYVREQIDERISSIDTSLLNIVVPYVVAISLLRLLMILVYYQMSRFRYSAIEKIFSVDRLCYESYLKQLAQLLELLEQNGVAYVKNYQFNLLKLDQKIYQQSLKKRDNTEQSQHTKSSQQHGYRSSQAQKNFTEPKFELIELKSYLYQTVSILAFIAVVVASYVQCIRFTDLFKDISYDYQRICNAQMYSTELVIYREYLYFYVDSIPFLQTVFTKQLFRDVIHETINEYKYFINDQLQKDYSSMDSETLNQFIKDIQRKNLCTDILQLNNENFQQDLSLCSQLLGGALTQGLTITIQKFIQEYQTEYDHTNFNLSYRQPNYITTQQREQYFSANYTQAVILKLSETIKSSMKQLTNHIIMQINTILYAYLAYIVAVYMILQVIYDKLLTRQLLVDKRLIMLIPQETFVTNKFLQVQIALILKKHKLVRV